MRLAVLSLLALLAAAPAAAQSGPPALPPGWIGFFADVESVDGEPRVIVRAVAEGSPAARAGLAQGDVVLSVDDVAMTDERLHALQTRLRAGDRLELTLQRGDRVRTVIVRAEPRPGATQQYPGAVDVRIDSARRRMVARAESQAEPESARRVAAVQEPTQLGPPEPVERGAPLPGAGSETPFRVHVFGDAQTDSLIGELRERERRLVQTRSAESARLRELAAQLRPGSTRVDASDPRLVELRRRRDAIAGEAALLRAALEHIVIERAGAPASLAGVPDGPLSPGAPAASGPTRTPPRPMTPYIVGRDRVAGARVTPLNPALAEYFGNARGILVVDVVTGTPAHEAGLRPGDVLLRVGGVEVDGLDALRRAVVGAPADRPTEVIVLRRGSRIQLTLPR